MKRETLTRTSVQIAPSELAAMAKLARRNRRTRSAQIRLAVKAAIQQAVANGEI